MTGVGCTVECTAASHSGAVEGEGHTRTYWGEISNRDEGRLVPSLPITILKTPSSQRRNTMSVEHDKEVLIVD